MTPRLRYLTLIPALLASLAAAEARAASLKQVTNWGASGVPTYVSMYIYVPDKVVTNPPILVVSHYCTGDAAGMFSQAQTGGVVAAADQYGFIMIFPQNHLPGTTRNCWDVGSKESLTHDGGGDTQAIAQMVKYTVTQYKANANRVYATGSSSGAMMTQALLAVYPDIFKAGAEFSGVAADAGRTATRRATSGAGTAPTARRPSRPHNGATRRAPCTPAIQGFAPACSFGTAMPTRRSTRTTSASRSSSGRMCWGSPLSRRRKRW